MVDYTGAGLGIAGLGLQLFGGLEAAGYAKKEAQVSQQEIGVEEQQDTVRRQAMEMSAHREMLQQVRNNQMARSRALTEEVAGGSQFGSGAQGVAGSISGQTGQNILGISNNLQYGESMFNLNAQLNQLKVQQAGLQANQATYQGIASIGSGVSSLGKLF